MEYDIEEERVGAPTSKVNEVNDELVNALAIALEMDRDKIRFFTNKVGLAWLDEPSIVGVTAEQLNRINGLRNFLRRIDE